MGQYNKIDIVLFLFVPHPTKLDGVNVFKKTFDTKDDWNGF